MSALQCCRNLQEIMMVSELCLPLVRPLKYNASTVFLRCFPSSPRSSAPLIFSYFPDGERGTEMVHFCVAHTASHPRWVELFCSEQRSASGTYGGV